MPCPSDLHDPSAKIRFPDADRSRAMKAFREWIDSEESIGIQDVAIAVLPALRIAFLAGADYEATYQLSQKD